MRVAAPIVAADLRGAARLSFIREALGALLVTADVCGGCSAVAIEGYSVGSANRPFDLGEISGVMRQMVHEWCHLECVVVPPTVLKKFATGNSHADKKAMMHALMCADSRYSCWYSTDDDNIADAIWLARYVQALNTSGLTMPRSAREALYASRPKVQKRKYRTSSKENL